MRLTEAMTLFNDRMYQMPNNKFGYSGAVVKLGQLEDIEEELGIDLVTLFKAYSNGFYVKGEEEKQYIDFENPLNAVAFKNREMFYGHKWTYQYVKLNDYGKTWALTKEELL